MKVVYYFIAADDKIGNASEVSSRNHFTRTGNKYIIKSNQFKIDFFAKLLQKNQEHGSPGQKYFCFWRVPVLIREKHRFDFSCKQGL